MEGPESDLIRSFLLPGYLSESFASLSRKKVCGSSAHGIELPATAPRRSRSTMAISAALGGSGAGGYVVELSAYQLSLHGTF